MRVQSFLATFLLICVGWYTKQTFIDVFPGSGPSDFSWYYLAAQQIVHGRWPYLATGYIYPPLTALLFTPLAALEYVPARHAWFVLSHCFLAASAIILWRRLGGSLRSACVVAFVWASGGAAEENLALGQIGPLLTLIVVIASFPGRSQAAAISFGFAIKLIPGALAVILLLRRSWRTLIVTLISAILLVGIPWLGLRLWLTGPKNPPSTGFLAGTAAILSWSAPSIALRAAHPPGADGKPPERWLRNNLEAVRLDSSDRALSLSINAIVMVVGMVAIWRVTGGYLVSRSMSYMSAALIALTLVAAPVCWTHYELLQYPGTVILLDRTVRERKRADFGAVVTSWVFLYTIPVAVLRAGYRVRGEWPNSPAYLYFWTSISAVASLCLFALALHAVRGCSENDASSK